MDKHINPALKNEYVYLVRTMRSSALGYDVPLPPENLNWQFFLELAKYNNCICLVYNAVSALPEQYLPPVDILNSFKELNGTCIVQDVNQQYELKAIFKDFENEGAYFLPMKGTVMKDEYPNSCFRHMSDADILFKVEQLPKVKAIMERHGVDFDYFDDDNQYHFEKKPFLFIEMHSSLLNHTDKNREYFLQIWNKSVLKEGCKYQFTMQAEDFYIYQLEHASNHYRKGGIGVRILLDLHLFVKNHPDMNWAYLNRQLEITGLKKFSEELNKISQKWFDNCDFEVLSPLEEFIFLSSTLGRDEYYYAVLSLEHRREQQKEHKKPSRLKFFLSSVFPSKDKMKRQYSYLEKFPFLLPASWIQMWGRRVFIDKNIRFKSGLKSRINYITDEDERYIETMMNCVGLDKK
ncbi:MAG: nucleotidyltransferase family protein [Ruminococcus sp.]|nr:nucleotidyltransferase family protein [Ruminococcus sp.]